MFNENLKKEIAVLNDIIKTKDDTNKELQRQKDQQLTDYESKEKILRNELAMEISKAVALEKESTNRVEQDNAVLKKEVEILEKAFENMGFDVKDMKDILNKLVDGLIAKNEIKLVK